MVTNSKTSFKNPRSHPSHGTERKVHRMVTREFLDMISKQSSEIPEDDWTGKVPRHADGFDTRYFATTQAEAFGSKKRITKASEKKLRGKFAGGNMGAKPQIGEEEVVRQSGATGEMLRFGSDPQDNSAAQRSWLYGPDPGQTAHANYAMRQERPRPEFMSLNLGKSEMPQPGPRRSTGITRVGRGAPSRNAGIWGD